MGLKMAKKIEDIACDLQQQIDAHNILFEKLRKVLNEVWWSAGTEGKKRIELFCREHDACKAMATNICLDNNKTEENH
jgi:hypothetical protein